MIKRTVTLWIPVSLNIVAHIWVNARTQDNDTYNKDLGLFRHFNVEMLHYMFKKALEHFDRRKLAVPPAFILS